MILVMTASVSPANVKQLCIKDPEIRLGQYCAAIHFYIKCKQIDKIVFCDNSDFKIQVRLQNGRKIWERIWGR